MAFEFIKEELTEARYLRRPGQLTGQSGYDVAETFFEHLLILQQLRYDDPVYAQVYAKDTLKYMNFKAIRPSATDLHNLTAVLLNPTKYSDTVSDLNNLSFDQLRFKRYLRNIIKGKVNESADRMMFYRMQKNLKIRNTFLKQARRIIADYPSANPTERRNVSTRMMSIFRRDQKYRSDLFKQYVFVSKNRSQITSANKVKGKIPGWVKGAAGIVGAGVAGYELGKRIG